MFTVTQREDVVLYGIYVYIYRLPFSFGLLLDFCQVFRIQTTN